MEGRYGPNVWAKNITFDYPDQGLRIPYQQYLDRLDVLDRILFIPENS
jgi:exodeoxyribonuclease V alpha subunit